MTTKEIRNAVKNLVLAKGIYEITNEDLYRLAANTGIKVEKIYQAYRYFTYSPQTAKYR